MTVVAVVLSVGVSPANAKTSSIDSDLTNALHIKSVPPSPIATAGWSFDAPFVSAALSRYRALGANNANSFAAYGAGGSGAGRAGVVAGSDGIGFSDVPLNVAGEDTTSLTSYVQVPVALSSVAVIYHVSFNTSDTVVNSFGSATTANPTGAGKRTCAQLVAAHHIALDGATLAQVFAGIITQWTDPTIVAQNPKLVVKVETPVSAAKSASSHRRATAQKDKLKSVSCLTSALVSTPSISIYDLSSDVGPTFMFRDYLSKVDPADFPTPSADQFTAATAEEASASDMAAVVSAQGGSIGYVDSSYALENSLATLRLTNAAGRVAALTSKSVTLEATAGLAVIKADGHCSNGFSLAGPSSYAAASVDTECFSLNDAGGAPGAYPIAGFSYAITQRSPSDNATAVAIAKFLEYLTQSSPGKSAAVSFGQNLATSLGLVAMPKSLQAIAFAAIQKMTLGNGTTSAVSSSL